MFWGNDEGDCFWRILERQRRVMADAICHRSANLER